MTPVKYLLLLLLATVFAVMAVAQQTCVVHLGLRVERLEAQTDRLAEKSRLLLCEISALSHPVRIAEAVERLNIGLLDPVALTQAAADVEPGEYIGLRRATSR